MIDTLASADAHDRTGVRANGAGAPPGEAPSFREVMAALNPLQHIPVLGSVYRAISGDVLPEPIRRVGSFVASGLLFGPLGLLSNVLTAAVEKATGFSVEDTAQSVMAGLGLGPRRDAAATAVAGDARPPGPAGAEPAAPDPDAEAVAPPAVARASPDRGAPVPPPSPPRAAPDAAPSAADPGGAALSPTQLAAYGITATRRGDLRMGGLEGADVLNAVELARIAAPTAVAAYARSGSPA